MERISKLFGRKTDANQEEAKASGSPAQPSAPVAQAADMVFGLAFFFESGESKTFTVLPIDIGRSDRNQIVLSDSSVSSVHAQVYYDDQLKAVCIKDCDSLNGLFIDEQPTRKNLLLDGVKLRLGSVTLTFRDTGYIHPGSAS
jgi:pSer/pThr/pTyr-binding forkhead associated (FHA) protein